MSNKKERTHGTEPEAATEGLARLAALSTSGAAGVVFDLSRRAGGKYGFLSRLSQEELDLEIIRAKFGGGDYLLQAKGPGGKYLSQAAFVILGKAVGAGSEEESPVPGGLLQRISALEQALERALERLNAGAPAPAPVPAAPSPIVSEALLLKLLETRTAPAGGLSLTDALALADRMHLAREPSSFKDLEAALLFVDRLRTREGSREEDSGGLFGSLLGQIAQAATTAAIAKRAAGPVPVRRLPPGRPPVSPVSPAKTQTEAPMSIPGANLLRMIAPALLELAETKTPEEALPLVLPYVSQAAYDVLERDDWLDVLTAEAPELAPRAEWLGSLRSALLAALDAEPEETE